jgi:hypothetical protein
MALIADSGGIYGLYYASEKKHKAIRAAFEAEPGLVIIPMPVLSEIDYLLRRKLGIRAELDFIDDIRAGAFTLEDRFPADLVRTRALLETYRDLDLGLGGRLCDLDRRTTRHASHPDRGRAPFSGRPHRPRQAADPASRGRLRTNCATVKLHPNLEEL